MFQCVLLGTEIHCLLTVSTCCPCPGPCPGPVLVLDPRYVPPHILAAPFLNDDPYGLSVRSQSSVFSSLPAVGHALDVLLHVFFPAVGNALLTSCRSALFYPLWGPLFWHPSRCSGPQASSPSRQFSVSALVVWLTVSGFIQSGRVRLDCWSHWSCACSPASLFASAISLAARAPNSHRLRSVVTVWRIASLLHVLTHVFDSARSLACPSWSGRPQPRRLAPPRSERVEAVSSRARLLWVLVALFGMVVNSAVPRA